MVEVWSTVVCVVVVRVVCDVFGLTLVESVVRFSSTVVGGGGAVVVFVRGSSLF